MLAEKRLAAVAQARFSVETQTAAQTRSWGERTGRLVEPGMVVALYGELGAGKTTFTQGLAVALGVQQRVTSPTFVFVNEYATARGWRLIHIDSYRLPSTPPQTAESDSLLADFSEADTLGLEDIFAADDAIVVIEWPERIAGRLPAQHLAIMITADMTTAEHNQSDRRKIEWLGYGKVYQMLVATLGEGDKGRNEFRPLQ